MASGNSFRHCWMPALLVHVFLVSSISAQGVGPTRPGRYGPYAGTQPRATGQQPQRRPPVRLAERTPEVPAEEVVPNIGPAQPNEHPLMPALRWAYDGMGNIEKIHDYSATLVKREVVDGTLGEYQYLFVKVRHQPLSVYLYFLGPAELKGREVIFIEGQNNGKMWAHGTGVQQTMFGTLSLPPTGLIAMRGQRYPLTEIGILNLVRRLIEVGEKDLKYGECEVKFFKGAKINDRSCTCIQVVHPVPRRNFLFHMARIFVDDELNVPIRFSSFAWPTKPGGPPDLLEEYTYLNMKLNNGFTDADFDTRNPNYSFR